MLSPHERLHSPHTGNVAAASETNLHYILHRPLNIGGTSVSACVLFPPKETSMRIIFVILVASVLSILGFKYMDNSIGDTQIMASPNELSAKS